MHSRDMKWCKTLSLTVVKVASSKRHTRFFHPALQSVNFFFTFIKSALLNRALCFVFRLICLLVIHTGRTYYSFNFVLFILFYFPFVLVFVFCSATWCDWLLSFLFIGF